MAGDGARKGVDVVVVQQAEVRARLVIIGLLRHGGEELGVVGAC